MLGILADDEDHAPTLDDFAVSTDFFDGSTDFHTVLISNDEQFFPW